MTQALPLTYSDLVLDLDLDPFASETTSDLQNLVQDITHLLLELPNSNPDDPNRGVGVQNYLSGTQDDLAKLPAIIERQILLDDRVNTCHAQLDTSVTPFVVKIAIGVSEGVIPFEFGWQNGSFTNLTQPLGSF